MLSGSWDDSMAWQVWVLNKQISSSSGVTMAIGRDTKGGGGGLNVMVANFEKHNESS